MKKTVLWLSIILANFIALFIGLLAFLNPRYEGLMVYFWILMLFNISFYYFAKRKGIEI